MMAGKLFVNSGMAKQIGVLKIRGCYDGVCFYKMNGEYYARMKSSLTGKRVKKDPAFKRTMEYAGLLGRASKIASEVYSNLAAEKKEKGAYKKLTGLVMRLLKEGKTKEEILLLLQPIKKNAVKIEKNKKRISSKSLLFADEIIEQVFSKQCFENKIERATAPP